MKGRAQDVNTKIPFTIRRKGLQMRLDKASFVLNLEGKALKITSTPFSLFKENSEEREKTR